MSTSITPTVAVEEHRIRTQAVRFFRRPQATIITSPLNTSKPATAPNNGAIYLLLLPDVFVGGGADNSSEGGAGEEGTEETLISM